MLDRYMDRQGWKHTWRGMLGDNRKIILPADTVRRRYFNETEKPLIPE